MACQKYKYVYNMTMGLYLMLARIASDDTASPRKATEHELQIKLYGHVPTRYTFLYTKIRSTEESCCVYSDC